MHETFKYKNRMLVPAPDNLPLDALLELHNLPNLCPCPCCGGVGYHSEAKQIFGFTAFSLRECLMCDQNGQVVYLTVN
jgi:hypothetical protein